MKGMTHLQNKTNTANTSLPVSPSQPYVPFGDSFNCLSLEVALASHITIMAVCLIYMKAVLIMHMPVINDLPGAALHCTVALDPNKTVFSLSTHCLFVRPVTIRVYCLSVSFVLKWRNRTEQHGSSSTTDPA